MSIDQKINLLLSCYQVLQPLTIALLALRYEYVPKGHMNWIIYIPFVGVPFIWWSFITGRKNRNKYLG